jgi:hypothetical protein
LARTSEPDTSIRSMPSACSSSDASCVAAGILGETPTCCDAAAGAACCGVAGWLCSPAGSRASSAARLLAVMERQESCLGGECGAPARRRASRPGLRNSRPAAGCGITAAGALLSGASLAVAGPDAVFRAPRPASLSASADLQARGAGRACTPRPSRRCCASPPAASLAEVLTAAASRTVTSGASPWLPDFDACPPEPSFARPTRCAGVPASASLPPEALGSHC